LFGGVAALTERWSVPLTSEIELSISTVPRILVAVLFGPLAAMLTGAAAMLSHLRRPYLRYGIYTCTLSVSGGLAGLAGQAASGGISDARAIGMATIAATVTQEALDSAFALVTGFVRGTGRPSVVLRNFLPVLPASLLLYTGLVGSLAYAYTHVSPWSIFFFALPALAAQRLFALYQAQRHLAMELSAANEELEAANVSFASALVATLEARDRYTAGHSAAVAIYARDIARSLGLNAEMQNLAHLSGFLHDIGKVGIPSGILEKPGPLTLQERRQIEQHSVIGECILRKVEAYSEISRIVRHHHERPDGCGYPDGLKGGEIPVISKIICVADAYNAMTSDRPYRPAMQPAEARSRLMQAAGTQFDSDVVVAFERVLEQANGQYLCGGFTVYAEKGTQPTVAQRLAA
jgi:putative nucleotidyltransferase with HDIG domain